MSNASPAPAGSSPALSSGGSPRRVAIVGGGGIARNHVRALRDDAVRERTPVELVAVVDIDQERAGAFAAAHDIAGAYDDLATMLAEVGPDLVHLCTPPGGHAQQSIACLNAGASVLCEKPPCLSLAEYDAILQAAEASAGVFSVVFQHRYGTGALHVRRLLTEGAFGRPFVGVCLTTWFRDHAYYAVPWRGRWDTEGGGPTMGHGIHQMDLLGHLLGDWEEIQAMTSTLDRPVETEDVSVAQIRFASGALASVVNSVLSPREESYIRLDCEQATIELTHLYGYSGGDWKITPLGKSAEVPAEWAFPEPDVRSSHTAQVADLLLGLDNGVAPHTGGAGGRRTMEIITGIYCSAATGRPVRRDELGPDNPFYHRLGGTD